MQAVLADDKRGDCGRANWDAETPARAASSLADLARR